MNEKSIRLEAAGEFPFKFFIEKAVPSLEKGEFVLEGIASTTNVDHDSERMSGDALSAMERSINDNGVPLRVEHSKSENAIIGEVYKAWVDDRNQLHIRARLDKSHVVSPLLYNSMKQGAKMGFSVGGIVKRAAKEFVESVGKVVKTFYDVALQEVSVTPRPANYDAYAVAKSLATTEKEADELRGSPWYKDFLNDNPQLDYLHAFSKSIKDEDWHPVEVSKEINQNKNMSEKTNKKAEDMKDDTETKSQPVTRNEMDALKTIVTKGFESIAGLMAKAMGIEAHDQNNPNVDKPKFVTPNAAKAMDTEAHDQNNPDKDKPKTVGHGTSKAADDTETDTKTKAADDTDTDTKTKATPTEETTEKYDLETVQRSINTIESLTKKIQGVKKVEDTDTDTDFPRTTKADDTETDTKTKAADDTETDTKTKAADDTDTDTKTKAADDTETDTKTKTIHPLDRLAVTMAKAFEAMVDKMEKTGVRYPGFEKKIMQDLISDETFQEEVQKMMKVPGAKRSVSMGVPYMTTKEGHRYALVSQTQSESIEKSQNPDKGKTFQEVFKTKYSSVRNVEE